MQKALLFLRLIRGINLLVLLLTQALFAYCILLPDPDAGGTLQPLSVAHIWLLISATVLVAAAGYIINDYFDIATDTVNKPDKMFITKGISKKQALNAYFGLNGMALVLALTVSWQQRNTLTLEIVLLCIFLLWIYSRWLKKSFLMGNLVVALVTALPILLLFFNTGEASISLRGKLAFIYSGFAFWVCLIRELVKDMEDMDGDRRTGSHTIPIVWGKRNAVFLAGTLSVMLVVMLVEILLRLLDFRYFWMAAYVGIFLLLPAAGISLKIFLSRTKADFHKISTWIKVLMLAGILSQLFLL